MKRKPYAVAIGTPRGTTEIEIKLTDGEADTVRVVAEEIMAAVEDGAIDFFDVEEAE